MLSQGRQADLFRGTVVPFQACAAVDRQGNRSTSTGKINVHLWEERKGEKKEKEKKKVIPHPLNRTVLPAVLQKHGGSQHAGKSLVPCNTLVADLRNPRKLETRR